MITATERTIIEPTKISTQPVAQGGMEAKMGAKKIEIKKRRLVAIAVRPVLPPSWIPAPDSMKAVTGGTPRMAPTEILRESTI